MGILGDQFQIFVNPAVIPTGVLYWLTDTASLTESRAIVECGAEGAPRHRRR
jgi:hypothetical protein